MHTIKEVWCRLLTIQDEIRKNAENNITVTSNIIRSLANLQERIDELEKNIESTIREIKLLRSGVKK